MKSKPKKILSEKDIDQCVVAQANDDSAWGKSIRVRRTKPASLSLPADLAARAAFLARLHRKASAEEWLWHDADTERKVKKEATSSIQIVP